MLLLDIKPINPGHLILITKEHWRDIFSIPEPLYSRMFKMTKKMAHILQKITDAPRIGLAIEGFAIPHVHIHLVPVYKGNELNPLRAKGVSARKLRNMQNEFARHFKKLR